MTFQRQLTELLHHASAAVLPRPQIPTEDLPLALAGHHALVVLLRRLHPLATGIGAAASPVWSGVEDVEGHPVALLGRLLSAHPSTAPISPIDAQLADPRSRLGAHWQQIGRAATVAMAEWDAADTATRPRGEAAWTVVAHVAGLSRALPVLDADLSRALADHGHPRSSAALAAAATSGLATVAFTVLDLARSGPLPELRLNPTPTKPIRVDCAPAVTAGQQRLARLLECGKQLHPSDVDLISKLQWRTARTAASVLSDTHPELASAMDDYRRALVDVPGSLGRVTSLDGRNPAAVVQVPATRATPSRQRWASPPRCRR